MTDLTIISGMGDGGKNCSLDDAEALRNLRSREPADRCPQRHWHAVHTRSRHEKVVAKELATKGIEHFLPLVPIRKRWSDRYVTVQEPLFPGYVLVRLAYRNYDHRVAVLSSTGVIQFVGNGKEAWLVPDVEVYSVQAMIHSQLECCPYPYLKEGMQVEVTHGPLAGATGILIREPARNRLIVSISLFAQSVSVEVDVADVRPC